MNSGQYHFTLFDSLLGVIKAHNNIVFGVDAAFASFAAPPGLDA
jgi:hypothetical protein